MHHKRWLRYSNDNTQVGADLKSFCDFHGMTQLFREPTRYEYLLDLACNDIHNNAAPVHLRIADHKALLVKLPLPVVLGTLEQRKIRILKEADWSQFKRGLNEYDWHIFQNGYANKPLGAFLEILWLHLV